MNGVDGCTDGHAFTKILESHLAENWILPLHFLSNIPCNLVQLLVRCQCRLDGDWFEMNKNLNQKWPNGRCSVFNSDNFSPNFIPWAFFWPSKHPFYKQINLSKIGIHFNNSKWHHYPLIRIVVVFANFYFDKFTCFVDEAWIQGRLYRVLTIAWKKLMQLKSVFLQYTRITVHRAICCNWFRPKFVIPSGNGEKTVFITILDAT